MRAVIAREPGGPEVLEIQEIAPPSAGPGEIELSVSAFGLNKVESYYRSGAYGTFVPGRALGVEAVGEVIRDPGGRFAVGQRVITAMGGLMFSRHGAYAERVAVKASHVLAVDSSLPAAKLAGLPVAYFTVWGGLDKNLEIASGQSILVRGATSSVGLAAVAYANARGLTVIGTTRNPASASRLREVGADHVVIDDGAIRSRVRELIPEGVDAALEVVGAATVRDTLAAVRPWGQVAVVGLLGGPPILEAFNVMGDLPSTVRLSSFSLGLLGTPSLPLDASPLGWVAERVAQGAMANTVSHTFPVDRIREAHRLLDSGAAGGKIVVSF